MRENLKDHENEAEFYMTVNQNQNIVAQTVMTAVLLAVNVGFQISGIYAMNFIEVNEMAKDRGSFLIVSVGATLISLLTFASVHMYFVCNGISFSSLDVIF
jgi:Mg2+ and Co2+ transporter CorA